MSRLPLMTVVVLVAGCAAQRESSTGARASRLNASEDSRLVNMERAARYPWKDEGRCVVREASGNWATLVENCYDALDRSRSRFVDEKGTCPVAQVGAISTDDMTRLVGICLLIQPEIAIGAVIVIGAVVVAAAISAEIEVARAKKPGCYCSCYKGNDGPYPLERVASPAVCAKRCVQHLDGYTGWVCK